MTVTVEAEVEIECEQCGDPIGNVCCAKCALANADLPEEGEWENLVACALRVCSEAARVRMGATDRQYLDAAIRDLAEVEAVREKLPWCEAFELGINAAATEAKPR